MVGTIAKISKPNTRHTLLPAVYTTVGPRRKQSSLGLQAVVCLSLSVLQRSVAALCFGDPCHLLILRICSLSQGSRLQFVNRRFLQFPALYATDPCCPLLLGTQHCSRRFLQIPELYPTNPCCPLRRSRRFPQPPWDPCYHQLFRTRLSRRSLLPPWNSCYLQLFLNPTIPKIPAVFCSWNPALFPHIPAFSLGSVLPSASQNPALYPAGPVATICSLLRPCLSSGALFTDVSAFMRTRSELAAVS